MHRYSYLYENIMFTNKWEREREEFAQIKSLIYARKKEHA